MERTKTAEIFAGFLEAHIFAHNPNNVGLLLDPLGSRTSFGHLTLGPQFYDCDRFPASVFCFEGLFGDQGMSFEKFTESFPERAGAVAVDDANPGNAREGGVVEKLVDALGCFLDG